MSAAENDESRGRGEAVRSLVVLLILAGVAVGVLWSMHLQGKKRRAGLAAENHGLRTQLAFVEAKHGEMLELLGRPQTVLVKLTGVGEWTGQAVNVAWNPVQRKAVVLLDRLPAAQGGNVYRLRAVGADGEAVVIGELNGAGVSEKVYSVPTGVGDRVGFDVFVGGNGDEGRVVFQLVKA